MLKLGHKYDLTSVSLVLQVAETGRQEREPAAKADSVDAMHEGQVQQMVREATADAQAGAKSPKVAPGAEGPRAGLARGRRKQGAGSGAGGAEDVEFDGADGKLEFSSASSIKAVADFYRSAMKQQGWDSRSSVINNANMVVLNFAKAGKAVSFTIMKMGNKTNVTADGSGLKAVAVRPTSPRGADRRRRARRISRRRRAAGCRCPSATP